MKQKTPKRSKTTYIEMGKLQKHSDELTEITIIKEYLFRVHDEMDNEINRESENAEKKNIPRHLITLFTNKLEERKKLIHHLMHLAMDEYWVEMKKMEK